MQRFAGATVSLVAAALAGIAHPGFALSVSTSADSTAAAWLRAHGVAPQPNELGELKAANPEAYAIVQALLTKRSLGLLNSRHPTASFAAGPAAPAAEVPRGPEAFQKIAEESGEKPKVTPLYPEAPAAPVHHNWLSWKPQQSALDDDSTVQNVIRAAPEAKALTIASPAAKQTVEAPVDPVAPTDAKPVAPMSQENSYLKGIDFGFGSQQPVHAQQSVEDNSYLKQFDLVGEGSTTPPPRAKVMGLNTMHSSSMAASSKDYLASFSWDDQAPASKAGGKQGAAGSAAAPTSPPAAAKKPHGKKDALLAWLSPPRKAQPAAAATKPPAPAAEENSYLRGLDLDASF